MKIARYQEQDDTICDSEEDYANADDYLQDNIQGSRDVSTKEKVLNYLEKFMKWSKTETEDTKCKQELLQKLNRLIKETKKEMVTMQFTKPKSEHYLGMDSPNFDDWLATNVMSNMVGKGQTGYLNQVVQMADYIANPAILKKNSLMLEEFVDNHLWYLQLAES